MTAKRRCHQEIEPRLWLADVTSLRRWVHSFPSSAGVKLRAAWHVRDGKDDIFLLALIEAAAMLRIRTCVALPGAGA